MQDPTIFLIAAVTGMGGFCAWLLRDYIAYLKAQANAWQQIAMRGVTVAEKVVDRAP